MKKDINWMLIESVVRRTVQKLHDSPEREIRNLIDLGLSFADGRFQRKFLKASQKMLRNEKSAYYPLIKDVVSHVDEERLVTFGMNLGYNGCTRGAKTIRQIEHEESFNIPWALSFSLNIAQIENGCYSSVIRQGTELGIYVYLMEASDPVEQSLALTAEHPRLCFRPLCSPTANYRCLCAAAGKAKQSDALGQVGRGRTRKLPPAAGASPAVQCTSSVLS